MTVPIFASLLDKCYAAGNLAVLRQSHACITASGLSPHHFLRSKLCAAYARCGCLHESLILLSFANRRPAFLYNSILRALSLSSSFSAALSLLPLMLHDCVFPDQSTISSSLSAAAAIPSLRHGSRLHSFALVSGLALNPCVSNSLISMYSKCGDHPSAQTVFNSIPFDHRTIVSYTAMISSYGNHNRARHALKMFDEMINKAPGTLDDAVVTAVLVACAHGGLVEEGKRVLELLERPRVEHYTCIVDMLGKLGRVEEAAAILVSAAAERKMDGEPDEALWAALLGACRAHGRLDVAETVAATFYADMD